MEYDDEILKFTQGIEQFLIKNEFTFAKNFFPGMKIKDKGKLYRCFINYYNSTIRNQKDKIFKYLFLIKSFLLKEENQIDMKFKSFWLDNMKKLVDLDEAIGKIVKEIDVIIEEDFLKSPDKFPKNNLEIEIPEKHEESFKENYLTAKDKEVTPQSQTSGSSLSSSSLSSRKHRFSLTPTNASNSGNKPSFFNNNGLGKNQPLKTSKVSKKMNYQFHTINASNNNQSAKGFFHLQKSNDSKPICLKPRVELLTNKSCPEKEIEPPSIQQLSTQISTFKLEDEIKLSNIEHINDIIKGTHTKTESDNKISNSNSTSNPMTNDEFILEKEIEGVNLIYKKEDIHYISLNLLIKKIAIDNYSETHQPLVYSFLQQYHTFIPIEVLFNKVKNMYKLISSDKMFYPGLIKFMNMWIILKFEDEIFPSKKLTAGFHQFYMEISSHPDIYNHFDEHEIRSIQEMFSTDSNYEIEYSINQLKGRKKSQNISFKSESLIPSVISDVFDVLEWNEAEIARQLTLISHQLFSKVEYKELFSAVWTKKNKYIAAPNVMKIIDRFNKFSLWIIEEILSYDKKRMRAGTIEKFIKIAAECRKLCNFNDCVNIISSMNNFIVKGMKKTWKVMNREVFPLLEELNNFCSYDNNYANMREEMRTSEGKPCVPYLGLLLKELAFIEEGPKYVKDNSLVNIEKIRNVARAINTFFSYKHQAYLFRPIEELTILSDPHPKSEEEIENLANRIEPCFTLSKTKTKKKRITNTDSKMYKLKPSYNEYLLRLSDPKGMKEIIQIDDHF